MLDFIEISVKHNRDTIEIKPKFKIYPKPKDLMIRGGDFYAVWDEEHTRWSTDESVALYLIDKELDKFKNEKYQNFDNIKILYMWDSESGSIDKWHHYCKNQVRDSFHMLDETIIFSNDELKKELYSSKNVDYPLKECSIDNYNKIIGTLYTPEERMKIEWAIGSIVAGDSKTIQKFIVLYGSGGTGKSTILNIIQALFEGYYSVFDAKALGSDRNSFALEPFTTNPLVAIQHDGDLSRIEDNTRLNSLVSHEKMSVNTKFQKAYPQAFKCFLFIGTNTPVRITDAKSGLIRRLIDVTPSGKLLSNKEYIQAMKGIDFELGGIAKHCLDVYLKNKHYYDDYVPISMLCATNDLYNFIMEYENIFEDEDGTSLRKAYDNYKIYCEDARVAYPLPRRAFTEELKNYFEEFHTRYILEDGTRIRSYYKGFKKIGSEKAQKNKTNELLDIQNNFEDIPEWLQLGPNKSILDEFCKDCKAQYATENEVPFKKWAEVNTTLKNVNTSKIHYLQSMPELIFLDFDLKNERGEKDLYLNLKAASAFPKTYAEVSKGGQGLHLYYIYDGDVGDLSNVYDVDIEIKKCTGNSSIRRKVSLCNTCDISTISSGLPKKGELRKMVDEKSIKSERSLRLLIKRNLNKEIHPSTAQSINFIKDILDEVYSSGLQYDVSDLLDPIYWFAANSTHQAQKCVRLVDKMKFKSEDKDNIETRSDDSVFTFFDIEIYPNLFVVCYKHSNDDKIIALINPESDLIFKLFNYKLIGFNNRKYDNHILKAASLGWPVERLYLLSNNIINGDNRSGERFTFADAYGLSYTDIYDFSSKKQSLKKWEIELGIHHKEMNIPWDQPVPDDMIEEVVAYCKNDVLATEAVFNYLQSDWTARKILADIAGMTVNDTTNSLTARIILGNDKYASSKFNWRNMGDTITNVLQDFVITSDGTLYSCEDYDQYTTFNALNQPIFPGYKFEILKKLNEETGKESYTAQSTYRDEIVGEGGYVYVEEGMYTNVALLDIASMHPTSIICEELFGLEGTRRFKELKDARIYIKHGEIDKVKPLLDGKFSKYLTDEKTIAELSTVLKIPINSVYGLTSAKFQNPFFDKRNKDNIVAKRGALFMINLKHEVQKRGYTVAHIKTDSIKIPNATYEIIEFVKEYGKMYGYDFEHEATYEKLCIINKAVYVARHASLDQCEALYGSEYMSNKENCSKNRKHPNKEWTSTGTEFSIPYIFKTLFSNEEITFKDLCETKSVTSALYLDYNENLPEDEHDYQFVGKVGSFCPILPGKGGALLLREKDGKYDAATGSKGYRWLEAEKVKELGYENLIDMSYYDSMVEEAIEHISVYGDIESFLHYDIDISELQYIEDADCPFNVR